MVSGFQPPKKVYKLPKQGTKAKFTDTPPEILRARIWGFMLGDSSLSDYRESATHPGVFVAVMRFCHGEDQKEYIFTKRKMLGQYTTMGINIWTPKEKGLKDTYGFCTKGYPWIGEIYPLWYTKWYNKKTGETHNIKIVAWNSNIFHELTPASLSSWMADDGSRDKTSGYFLHTGELPLPCLALLRGVLEKVWHYHNLP
jgi:hypothetical protein